jgi:glycosyltransferase involved in cell wall biosynthesis
VNNLMNNEIIISVIIPTYNRVNLILRAVTSVINQTFNKYELIIVDDGSTDDTKRIVYVKHSTNLGQNAALNTGLKYANGEYVAFLDSDDEWIDNYLEKQINNIINNKDVDCSYTGLGFVDVDGNHLNDLLFTLEGYIYKEALTQGYVSSMIGLMVKKNCFEKIGFFDTDFTVCQDDDICLRLAKYYCFKVIKEPLAVVHSDAMGRVTNCKLEVVEGWFRLFNKYETEILNECGVKILLSHYKKIFNDALFSKHYEISRKIVLKIVKYRKRYNIIFGLLQINPKIIIFLIRLKRIIKNIKVK